jgi:uncharacterized protein
MLKNALTAPAILIAMFVTMAQTPTFGEDTKMNHLITISGHGEVRAVPDMAVINMGVASSAETARAALDANTKAMTELMANLKAANIDDKDVTTSNFSVSPRLDYGQNGGLPPKLVGYDVTNTVTVIIHKIDSLGALLDKAVSSGSNQINGIAFSVSKPDEVLDEARKLAVKDATHKAQIYAGAASINLGNIVSLSESSGLAEPPINYSRAKAMSADSAPVPIAQGSQVISVDVNISWELK